MISLQQSQKRLYLLQQGGGEPAVRRNRLERWLILGDFADAPELPKTNTILLSMKKKVSVCLRTWKVWIMLAILEGQYYDDKFQVLSIPRSKCIYTRGRRGYYYGKLPDCGAKKMWPWGYNLQPLSKTLEVKQWVQLEIVTEVREPFCVSPLSTASKIWGQYEGHRWIWMITFTNCI